MRERETEIERERDRQTETETCRERARARERETVSVYSGKAAWWARAVSRSKVNDHSKDDGSSYERGTPVQVT